MNELWEILSSYPTSIYTVLLGVLLVFWVFTIIGALDIDVISFDTDIDVDAELEIPGFVGLMHTLGFIGVPFTIVLSVLILLSWILTYLFAAYILPWIPTELLKIVSASIVIVVSFILAVPITTKIVAPLRKLAETNQAKSNKDYIGYACKVTSQTVDESFGQGFIDDGGGGLNVRIRAKSPNNISRGGQVRVILYDKNSHSYQVITEQEFNNY